MHGSTGSASSYPRNSRHAAGRLVALALIANGEIKAVEWGKLRDTGAVAQLGLAGHEWHDIVDALCQDLLATATVGSSCLIDAETLARWFDALVDRETQARVIFLSTELILADGRIDPGESALLRVATERWGPRRSTAPASPDPSGTGGVPT